MSGRSASPRRSPTFWGDLRAVLIQQGVRGLLGRVWGRLRRQDGYPAWQRSRAAWLRRAALPRTGPRLGVVLTGGSAAGREASLTSLRAQTWQDWFLAEDSAEENAALWVRLPGGVLPEPHAFALAAVAIRRLPGEVPFLYGDDAGLDGEQPRFKPDWSPDSEAACPYCGPLLFVPAGSLQRAGLRPEELGGEELPLRLAAAGGEPWHLADVLARVPADLRSAEGRPVPVLGGVKPRVSLLILTRDRADLLRDCLSSLFALTEYPDFEVLLVDNGSAEAETSALLDEWQAREPQRLRVLRDGGPFNFSRLNNRAAAVASGELLLLLNNDTRIIQADWLERLAGQAWQPGCGAAGALLLFPTGGVQHGGIVLGGEDLAVHAFRGAAPDQAGYLGRLRCRHTLSAVTGACLMVRRELYERAGGLDEAFAVAGGDIDLCLRLGQAGQRTVMCPDVRLIHAESATRGREDNPAKWQRMQEEYALLRERWPRETRRDPFYNIQLSPDGRFRVRAAFQDPLP